MILSNGFQLDSNTSIYHITISGFTLNEFVSYLEKLKIGKEPKPFTYDLNITNVHFIADVNLSKSEVINAIKIIHRYWPDQTHK